MFLMERLLTLDTKKTPLDDSGMQPDGMRMDRKRTRMQKECVCVRNDIFTVMRNLKNNNNLELKNKKPIVFIILKLFFYFLKFSKSF